MIQWHNVIIWLRALAYMPLCLILAVPAIYSTHLAYGVNTSKFFWVFFTSATLLPVLLHQAFAKRKIKLTHTDIFVSLLLLYCMGCSYFAAHDFENKKLIFWCCAGLVYFSIRKFLNHTHKDERTEYGAGVLLSVIFCVAIFTGNYAILQKLNVLKSFNDTFPLTSTFFHPAAFAAFSAMVLPLAFLCWLFLNSHSANNTFLNVVKWLALVATAVIVFILPSTGSRTACVGAATGVLLVVFAGGYIKLPAFFRSTSRMNFIAPVLIVVILAGIYGLYKIRESSVKGRFLIWRISWQMISERPVFGHGMDSFRHKYPDYQIEFFKSGVASPQQEFLSYEVTTGFNEVVQVLCELGSVGLLLFAFILYSVYKSGAAARETGVNTFRHTIVIAAKGSLAGGVFTLLFGYPFSLPELTVFFFALIAFTQYEGIIIQDKRIEQAGRLVCITLWLAGGIILLMAIPRYFKDLQAHAAWHRADKMFADNHAHEGRKLYKQLFVTLKNNDQYLSRYAKNLAVIQQYDSSIQLLLMKQGKTYNDLILLGDNYKASRNYHNAERAYQDAQYLLPHKFYPPYMLMKLYVATNRPDKAKEAAQVIIDKAIKINSFEVASMKKEAETLLAGKAALYR